MGGRVVGVGRDRTGGPCDYLVPDTGSWRWRRVEDLSYKDFRQLGPSGNNQGSEVLVVEVCVLGDGCLVAGCREWT